MPTAPVHRLKKQDIIWLANHRCQHGHSYLEHYNCYLIEQPQKDRRGYLDIETSNLNANFGIMFCYCIKDSNSDKIFERSITKKELAKDLDKEVVIQCVKDLQQFDRIVTFYGSKFDLKFIRTRAQYHKVFFPSYGALLHTDVYYIIRNRFKLHSNRLENACEVLLGETNKSRFNSIFWIKALQGDAESLKYILEHCRNDVLDLEKLHDAVLDYAMQTNRSI